MIAPLYQLTAEYDALMDRVLSFTEDGEIPADLAAEMDAIEGDITAKLEACAKMVRTLDARSKMFREEAARIARNAQASDNAGTRLKAYILEHMDRMGWEKRETGVLTIRIQDNPPSVAVRDLDAVPHEFDRPQAREIDKTAVKDAIKRGVVVPGVELVTGKHVRIR